MARILSFLLALTIFSLAYLNGQRTEAKEKLSGNDFLYLNNTLETKTNFEDRFETVSSVIPFGTDFVDDPETEYGSEKETEKGVDGERIRTFRITTWHGREVARRLDSEKIIKPINQKAQRGTKIIWRELPTQDEGTLKYWRKMRVWATSYDPNCLGCTGRTYSGTAVVVGTCAVDPKIIVMGSHFYVPGYGLCSALDIGGAIKGNKIDLGFPDVRQGWWSARYTDIYLIDGEPKK